MLVWLPREVAPSDLGSGTGGSLVWWVQSSFLALGMLTPWESLCCLTSSPPFSPQGTEPISPSLHYHLDPDGTLLIASPSPGDTGTYFCTATNTAGFSRREMQLSVSSECRDWPGTSSHKAAPESGLAGQARPGDSPGCLGLHSQVPAGSVGWEELQ